MYRLAIAGWAWGRLIDDAICDLRSGIDYAG
jgi:hypothetical protein